VLGEGWRTARPRPNCPMDCVDHAIFPTARNKTNKPASTQASIIYLQYHNSTRLQARLQLLHIASHCTALHLQILAHCHLPSPHSSLSLCLGATTPSVDFSVPFLPFGTSAARAACTLLSTPSPASACARSPPNVCHASVSAHAAQMTTQIPPAPPIPPPKQKSRSYFERFVAQPLTTAYASRPPSAQPHGPNGGPPNVLVPKLPGYVCTCIHHSTYSPQ
jgi:hypothetical protein